MENDKNEQINASGEEAVENATEASSIEQVEEATAIPQVEDTQPQAEQEKPAIQEDSTANMGVPMQAVQEEPSIFAEQAFGVMPPMMQVPFVQGGYYQPQQPYATQMPMQPQQRVNPYANMYRSMYVQQPIPQQQPIQPQAVSQQPVQQQPVPQPTSQQLEQPQQPQATPQPTPSPIYQQPIYQSQPQQAYHQTPPPVATEVQMEDTSEQKKGSRGWIIGVAAAFVLIVIFVMVLISSTTIDISVSEGSTAVADTSAVSSSSSSSVSITLPVSNKPVLDDDMYEDKETGLLTTTGAVEYAEASVVNIYVYSSTVLTYTSAGSGIIISDDGYILTNAHVIEDGTRFKAMLSDGREYEATVIGSDEKTDIAVIKIDAEDITSATIGVSSELKRGETVLAIGNAGGYTDSVSIGCVSYVHREISSYNNYPITCVQTDACLNFGNSGGALVNMYGQVVGMVTSKYTSSSGSEKIGFAIASDFFVPIVEDIISKGYVSGRARVGIIYGLITADVATEIDVKPGLRVVSISDDCDISNTELQIDDIITAFDDVQMLNTTSVTEFVTSKKPGDVVTASVYRKSITGEVTEFEITFTLEEDTTSSAVAVTEESSEG